MADNTIFDEEGGIYVANGSMKVNGNLEATGQTTTNCLKVLEDGKVILSTATDNKISFNKIVDFLKPVQFNNGQTMIGVETTYNSAYVGSPTIQAGERLVVGDSLFKIDAASTTIVADRFKQTLNLLEANKVVSKKGVSDQITTKKINVTEELVGNQIFADTIKTNNLYMENFSGLNITASSSLNVKDIIVGGSAKIQNNITIMGKGSANGAALTVNGGQLIANKGIVSHTRNNQFQCLQIMGSGTEHDTCFRIDKNVDSLIEGNVTIQDSNLILDNSRLATDEIVVTPLNAIKKEEPTSGIQLTTSPNWDAYQDGMVDEIPAERQFDDDGYDPYAEVESAMDRVA